MPGRRSPALVERESNRCRRAFTSVLELTQAPAGVFFFHIHSHGSSQITVFRRRLHFMVCFWSQVLKKQCSAERAPAVLPREIERCIYSIRGKKVMLDRGLAELYEVRTIAL